MFCLTTVESSLKCEYIQMEGPTETKNRGKTIGKTHENIVHLNGCIDLCKRTMKCESFLYHTNKKQCTLKELKLSGSEPIVKKNSIYFSVFKFHAFLDRLNQLCSYSHVHRWRKTIFRKPRQRPSERQIA